MLCPSWISRAYEIHKAWVLHATPGHDITLGARSHDRSSFTQELELSLESFISIAFPLCDLYFTRRSKHEHCIIYGEPFPPCLHIR
jgi:hypothetical protein